MTDLIPGDAPRRIGVVSKSVRAPAGRGCSAQNPCYGARSFVRFGCGRTLWDDMSGTYKISATEFIDHGSETYTFLKDPVVDALLQVVLELGAENWITRRRMMVLERVMAAKNLVLPEDIETYVPTTDDATAWRLERDRMLKSVYSALARQPHSGDAAAVLAKQADAPKVKPGINN
jgi:hypothetical protein